MSDDFDYFDWLQDRQHLIDALRQNGGISNSLIDGFQRLERVGLPNSEHFNVINDLAGELLDSLKQHKAASVGDSPVRRQGMLAPSTIATAAMFMLDFIAQNSLSSPPSLRSLLFEALDLRETGKSKGRKSDKREQAARVLALIPDIGVRQLAKLVGAAPSSVSRWRPDPDFINRLGQLNRMLEEVPQARDILIEAIRYSVPKARKLLPDEEST